MIDVAEELKLLVRSRYPVVYLLTFEEERARTIIDGVAGELKKKVVDWTVTARDATRETGPGRAAKALEDAIASGESALFVLRDLHPFMEDPFVVRTLRDLVTEFSRSHKTLVIVAPILKLPAELEKDVTILDLPLPGRAEIEGLLAEALAFVEKNPKLSVSLTAEERDQVVDATLGLTVTEARRIYSKAMLTDHTFCGKDIDLILYEKKQLIRKSGHLEYFDASDTVADVGGMEGLKGWLTRRRESFGHRAREYGLPLPKGVLLLGVQGCGKSLTAKAVASLWNQPLLRLDVGKIFSSYIGSSEENMRRAIATAESLAPVILWIDEIEKGFSGIKSSGATDAGVTSRIFGTFLTWMQEKTAPVFVIATANSIEELPPELLRKGRFDEIFFVDLPGEADRAEILGIHLSKRRRDPAAFPLAALAKRSEGYSGAELEMAVVEAMYRGFAGEREFTGEDIARAIDESVPLSRTMSEKIAQLRAWAAERARMATG